MDLLRHGIHKFPQARLLASSRQQGWVGIAAELRSHPSGDIAAIQPDQVEVTIAVNGEKEAIVSRKGAGVRQETRVLPGQIWISPVGLVEDDIRITRPLSRILHLYLPTEPSPELSELFPGRSFRGDSLRYLAGVNDGLILQIGMALLGELTHESPGGKVLAESLAHSLTVRLLHAYTGGGAAGRQSGLARWRLDDARMRRALEFMSDRLHEDISLGDIAEAAHLSPYHFARMFKNTLGMPPHRYLAQLRLEAATRMLSQGELRLADIATACRFSTQANFTRSFKQATGVTPGQYRAARLAR